MSLYFYPLIAFAIGAVVSFLIVGLFEFAEWLLTKMDRGGKR